MRPVRYRGIRSQDEEKVGSIDIGDRDHERRAVHHPGGYEAGKRVD